MFNTAAPVTRAMGDANLSWIDVQEVAAHVVSLLEFQGSLALTIVRNLLKLVRAVAGRDMLQVFVLLNQEYVDVSALVTAVRAEFGL